MADRTITKRGNRKPPVPVPAGVQMEELASPPVSSAPVLQDVYANGRKAALECLDSLMADKRNLQLLHDDMQEKFESAPTAFFQEVVAPLIPKEQLIRVEGSEKAPVRLIFPEEQPNDAKQ